MHPEPILQPDVMMDTGDGRGRLITSCVDGSDLLGSFQEQLICQALGYKRDSATLVEENSCGVVRLSQVVTHYRKKTRHIKIFLTFDHHHSGGGDTME